MDKMFMLTVALKNGETPYMLKKLRLSKGGNIAQWLNVPLAEGFVGVGNSLHSLSADLGGYHIAACGSAAIDDKCFVTVFIPDYDGKKAGWGSLPSYQ